MKDKRQRQAMTWPFGTPLADPSLYAYLLNAAAASSMPPHSIYHPFPNCAIGPFSGYLPTALPSLAGSPIAAHPAHRFLYGGAAHPTDVLPGVVKFAVGQQSNVLPYVAAAADLLVAGGNVGAKNCLLANGGLSSLNPRSVHIGTDPIAPEQSAAAAAAAASFGFPDLRTASAAIPSAPPPSKFGYPSSARELFKPYKTTNVERR